MPLQGRVHAVEILVLQQEFITAHVPGDVAGIGHDLFVVRRSDEAALRFLKIPLIFERQRAADLLSELDGER